jgi:hypothetical protein
VLRRECVELYSLRTLTSEIHVCFVGDLPMLVTSPAKQLIVIRGQVHIRGYEGAHGTRKLSSN